MEHNSELRLIKALDDIYPDEEAIYNEWDAHYPKLLALIEEHDRQVAIKELNLCKDRYHNIHSGFGLCVPEDYVEMRIAELQSPTQKNSELKEETE